VTRGSASMNPAEALSHALKVRRMLRTRVQVPVVTMLRLQAALSQQNGSQEQLRSKLLASYQTVVKVRCPPPHASMQRWPQPQPLQAEGELAQALVLSVMPLDDLEARAQRVLSLNQALRQDAHVALEDLLAKELVAWFKHHFFSWVSCLHTWRVQSPAH
jgi:hypothetical protein